MSPQRYAFFPNLFRPAVVPSSTDRNSVGPAWAYASGAVRQVDRLHADGGRRHNGVDVRGAQCWPPPTPLAFVQISDKSSDESTPS